MKSMCPQMVAQMVPPALLILPSHLPKVVCFFSKSHLLLLPRPAFYTLRMDFSLWTVRPLCGFPTGFLFVVGGQTLSYLLLPGIHGVSQRATWRVLFYLP